MDDVLRISFEYRDGQFVELPPRRLRMVLPEADTGPGERALTGRFVELRSAEGATLEARRVPGDRIPTVEYPTGDPERPFGRTEPPPRSVISVVLPANDQAAVAALVDVEADRTRGVAGVQKRDLAVVSLNKRDEP